MALKIIFSDITTMNTDAVVNTTDQYYSGGDGVDKKIHSICGDELNKATSLLPRLRLGEAKVTEAFGLKAKYIIHTSAPHWRGSSYLALSLLGSCYRNSISTAHALGCKSIAFPLIASRGKHFPKEIAFTTAVNAINETKIEYPDMDVYLVLYDSLDNSRNELTRLINDAINCQYIPKDDFLENFTQDECNSSIKSASPSIETIVKELLKKPTEAVLNKIPIDETFSQMLKRIMKERNISNAYIQDNIGITGPGLWKLLSGKSNPTKMTAFAIAITLRLSLPETEELLMKAGYAINKSSIEDVIIASLIQNGIYDRYTIDDLLYSLDLTPLPGAIID